MSNLRLPPSNSSGLATYLVRVKVRVGLATYLARVRVRVGDVPGAEGVITR